MSKKMPKNLSIGDRITFQAIDDFVGQEIVLSGRIIGDGKAIREISPMEFAGVDDNYFLVRVNEGRVHVVNISEIL